MSKPRLEPIPRRLKQRAPTAGSFTVHTGALARRARTKNSQGAAGRSPAIRRLRAAYILHLKLAGYSNRQVGAVLNMHEVSITKELRWAKKQGLVEKLEQTLLERHIPRALEVLEGHLASDNLKAAGLALKFLQTFSMQSAQKDLQPIAPAQDPLEAYFEALQAKAQDAALVEPAQLPATVTVSSPEDLQALAAITAQASRPTD